MPGTPDFVVILHHAQVVEVGALLLQGPLADVLGVFLDPDAGHVPGDVVRGAVRWPQDPELVLKLTGRTGSQWVRSSDEI